MRPTKLRPSPPRQFYGPRTGALFVRGLGQTDGAPLLPMLFGGGQERDYRPGTENIGMNAALGVVRDWRRRRGCMLISPTQAAQEIVDHLEDFRQHMLTCRQHLERRLLEVFGAERVRFNGFDGAAVERLPNTLNFSLLGAGS